MKKDTATHPRVTHTTGQPLPTPTDKELRAVAIKRVKAKRDFRGHLYVYLVVNRHCCVDGSGAARSVPGCFTVAASSLRRSLVTGSRPT